MIGSIVGIAGKWLLVWSVGSWDCDKNKVANDTCIGVYTDTAVFQFSLEGNYTDMGRTGVQINVGKNGDQKSSCDFD